MPAAAHRRETNESVPFFGLERVVGRIDGQSGSFVWTEGQSGSITLDYDLA